MRQDGCRYTFEQLSHLKIVPRFFPVPFPAETVIPPPRSASSRFTSREDVDSISPAADTSVVEAWGGGVPDSESFARDVSAAAAVDMVTGL